MRFRINGIETECDFILFFCLLPSALLLQSRTVIKMLFRTHRHVRYKPCSPLELRHIEVRLPKPERAERHNKHRHPFEAVPGPAGKNAAQSRRRGIGCSTRKSERLARGALSHFPNKSIVIKMK